jgi:hypothetical protein
MKLENIRIAKSAVDDQIYAGYPNKDKISWKSKVDVTNDVIRAVIDRWGGYRQTLKSSNSEEYEITVKKISKKSPEETQQEFLKELKQLLKKYGAELSVEEDKIFVNFDFNEGLIKEHNTGIIPRLLLEYRQRGDLS